MERSELILEIIGTEEYCQAVANAVDALDRVKVAREGVKIRTWENLVCFPTAFLFFPCVFSPSIKIRS